MWENEANKQLQCWPTPTIFVKRGQGDLAEQVLPLLQLSDFVAVTGQIIAGQQDAVSVSIGLSTMLVNGKQPLTGQNDSFTASPNLSAFVAVTADNIGTQSDSFVAAPSLSAFVAVTAQVKSVADDYVTQVALSAMTVP